MNNRNLKKHLFHILKFFVTFWVINVILNLTPIMNLLGPNNENPRQAITLGISGMLSFLFSYTTRNKKWANWIVYALSVLLLIASVSLLSTFYSQKLLHEKIMKDQSNQLENEKAEDNDDAGFKTLPQKLLEEYVDKIYPVAGPLGIKENIANFMEYKDYKGEKFYFGDMTFFYPRQIIDLEKRCERKCSPIQNKSKIPKITYLYPGTKLRFIKSFRFRKYEVYSYLNIANYKPTVFIVENIDTGERFELNEFEVRIITNEPERLNVSENFQKEVLDFIEKISNEGKARKSFCLASDSRDDKTLRKFLSDFELENSVEIHPETKTMKNELACYELTFSNVDTFLTFQYFHQNWHY